MKNNINVSNYFSTYKLHQIELLASFNWEDNRNI